jgi:hypothetical protein
MVDGSPREDRIGLARQFQHVAGGMSDQNSMVDRGRVRMDLCFKGTRLLCPPDNSMSDRPFPAQIAQ